jgi:membrane protein DedA with SNARE-associated domain
MITAGSAAELNGAPLSTILTLSLITGLGKTLGASILYIIGDIAEDFVLKSFGKFWGISHNTVEEIGSKLEHGIKDIIVLAFLRAMPAFPGTPVALACGMIKLNFYRYFIATFIGTSIRSLIFGYIGYVGFEKYQNILNGVNSIESILTILGIVGLAVFIYIMRKRNDIE